MKTDNFKNQWYCDISSPYMITVCIGSTVKWVINCIRWTINPLNCQTFWAAMEIQGGWKSNFHHYLGQWPHFIMGHVFLQPWKASQTDTEQGFDYFVNWLNCSSSIVDSNIISVANFRNPHKPKPVVGVFSDILLVKVVGTARTQHTWSWKQQNYATLLAANNHPFWTHALY